MAYRKNVLVKNENEDSKEIPKKESLWGNFKICFLKKAQKKDFRKIITIADRVCPDVFCVIVFYADERLEEIISK
ncbi:hypothetical protein [Flavobacterium johnsoniae]|uniref:hypothetical protein n=1 Tax=Flavobacterium johnsoniae TaxID=986 RepID=UPI000932B8DF|nr:hypothetical protein [Flavobacterium johnsoniae]